MTTQPQHHVDLFTLDEVTERVGVTARNVRFYTTRGLLPPPIRQGRSACYTPEHVARLELIRDLQSHGFTLAAIEGYAERIPAGATAGEIALHSTLLAPWVPDTPESLTLQQLVRRAGRDLGAHDLATLEAIGVAASDGEGRFDVRLANLGPAVAMLDLGLPRDAVVAAKEAFERHGRAIAEELTDIFRREVWPAYRDSGVPPERLKELVERFKPVTITALITAYEEAVNETKRETVQRQAARPVQRDRGAS